VRQNGSVAVAPIPDDANTKSLLSQTPNLAHYSSYPESALIPTANLMLNYVLKPIKHQSFFRKYAGKKFMKVSVVYITFYAGCSRII
jgi:hypothetical protein